MYDYWLTIEEDDANRARKEEEEKKRIRKERGLLPEEKEPYGCHCSCHDDKNDV